MPARPLALRIEAWFVANQRPLPWRQSYDPYAVWVSEVMLQQTRMEVVLNYLGGFLQQFPDVASLAAAEEEQVLAAWSGLGYYRRARMLHTGARDVVRRFRGRIPEDIDDLQTIAGIGRYTAGAIASIAYGQPAPIVDGNVARVVARLFAIDAAPGSPSLMREAWHRAEELVAASRSPRDLNQGLMEIGALLCRPANPECPRCPLRRMCIAYRTDRVDELPRRKEKAATRAMKIPLLLITDGRGRVLMRREHGALMHGMFHLPHGVTSLLGAATLRATLSDSLGSFRHTITNRRVEFTLHPAMLEGRIGDSEGEYTWIDPATIAQFPHPSYVKKALRLAEAKSAIEPAC
ncbi:MAG: A/G-specific adenine glycosylase [Thermoanaerobaculia bacterium]